MFLSDSMIANALRLGQLAINPVPDKTTIQPSSVDLHLGSEFKVFDVGRSFIDPLEEQAMRTTRCPEGGSFELRPYQFALGHTVEMVGVDTTLAAQVDGKSSLARLGLQVHMTSGFIDPGFRGQITLEFFNAAPKPIILRPGMVIAQLFVIPMHGLVERPYGHPDRDSRYQNQRGATKSRYSMGRESADFTAAADEVRPPSSWSSVNHVYRRPW